jgi:hypothetical protein
MKVKDCFLGLVMRFGTMGTKSPGLGREEQGAYHELTHSA